MTAYQICFEFLLDYIRQARRTRKQYVTREELKLVCEKHKIRFSTHAVWNLRERACEIRTVLPGVYAI